MATAKENLNAGCRVCNPSDTNPSCKLGDMLEQMRTALWAALGTVDAQHSTTYQTTYANLNTTFDLDAN